MAATVKDIAAAAGVSKAAVSKVLHDSSSSVRVGQERARIIREIADQMGYVPNAHARMLKQRRTNTIGLYFEHLNGIASGPLYTMHLLDGVCRELFQRHYRVALLAELDEDHTVRSLGDGRLDGVIWCKVARDEQTLLAIENCPIPIVALNTPEAIGETSAVFVRCDNAGGIDLAVEHLWALGHRRILFLNEHAETVVADCIDRREGFVQAMARRGAPVGAEDLLTWSWFLDEAADWWASKPPHTAVIAWSESCAGRLLERLAGLGASVPDDLSVIGFDSTQFCDTTRPRLTAVRQPIAEMAALAARELVRMIEGEPSPVSCHTLPCPLDVRRSTAKPRRRENP